MSKRVQESAWKGVGTDEVETCEFGIKEPPECEERYFRKIRVIQNSLGNQDLDQNCVLARDRKLLRDTNQNPTMYSQDRQQGDSQSSISKKLGRK